MKVSLNRSALNISILLRIVLTGILLTKRQSKVRVVLCKSRAKTLTAQSNPDYAVIRIIFENFYINFALF